MHDRFVGVYSEGVLLRTLMVAVSGVVCAALSACVADLDLAEDVHIACSDEGDCPAGFTCRRAIGRCFAVNAADTPVELVAGSVTRIPETPLRDGARLELSFRTNQPLARAPEVTLQTPLPQPLSLVSGHEDTWTFALTADAALEPEGVWPVAARLIGARGNEAAGVPLTLVELDFSVPRLAASATVTPTRLGDHGNASVTFSVTEPVAMPLVQLQWPARSPVDLVFASYDAATRTYVFAHAVTGEEAEDTASVQIALRDLAGNEGEGFADEAIVFDRRGPAVALATTGVQLLPPADGFLREVPAAAVGTTVRVIFTLDEAASADPVVETDSDPSVALSRTLQIGDATYVYEHTLSPDMAYPQGLKLLRVRAVDDVGNIGETILGADVAVSFDTVPPSLPAVSTAGAVVIERRPWGGPGLAGSRLEVIAQAGALTPCEPVDPDRCECCGYLLAFSGPEATPTALLGMGRASPQGAVALTLGGGDRVSAWVAAMDAAGNLSDADPLLASAQGVPIDQGRWVASLAGKLAQDSVSNPHRVRVTPQLDASPATALSDTALAEPSQLELDGLADLDGAGPSVSGMGRWRWQTPRLPARPLARGGARLVYHAASDRTLMFGGSSSGAGLCGDSGNQCADTWFLQQAAWMPRGAGAGPSARSSQAMAYDANRQRVVVFGGAPSAGDTWEWDGEQWFDASPQAGQTPGARLSPAMAYDESRARVVLYGGLKTAPCGGSGSNLCADVWEWDGVAWTPRGEGGGPGPRMGHGMVYDSKRGVTLIFGGSARSGTCHGETPYFDGNCLANDLWGWNGSEWLDFTPAAGLPPERAAPMLVYDPLHEEIVLHGGTNGPQGSDVQLSDTWLFRFGEWRLADSAHTPGALGGAAGTYDSASGRVLLFGGRKNPLIPASYSDETWAWDGFDWSRIVDNVAPSERAGHELVYDPKRRRTIALFGNAQAGDCDGGGSVLCSDPWEWTGDAWEHATPVSGPDRRFSAAATFVDVGDTAGVLVFGGSASTASCDGGASARCRKTWLWDGAWQDLTPTDTSKSPTARSSATLAFDPTRGVAVLFGGDAGNAGCTPINAGHCGDVWEWSDYGAAFCGNGEAHCWKNVTPGSGMMPEPRVHAGMAFDPVDGGIIVFGGSVTAGPTTYYPGTWRWNGAWQPLTTVHAPSTRSHAQMVTVAEQRAVVLFGGLSSGGTTIHRDLWSWAAGDWHQETPQAPASGGYSGAAYHEATRELLVFGGNPAYNVASADLWRHSRSARDRPGAWIEIDVPDAGVSLDRIRALRAMVHAQGSGFEMGSAASRNGARLSAWDAVASTWRLLAAEEATTSMFDVSISQPAAAQALVDKSGVMRLRVEPTGGQGPLAPNLLLDYVEVAFSYDLSLSPSCHNGALERGEQCDDGNPEVEANGCGADCERLGFCGDGVVQSAFEACEIGEDGCSSRCTAAASPCCDTHVLPACASPGDPATEACVCAVDPSCCQARWDAWCAELVTVLACAACAP